MRNLRNDERGSALMAVLGVMAVTIVIGMTITAATVNGLGVTSSSRASVQARAAAEAGVDVAVAGLQTTGSCAAVGHVYKSAVGAVPSYRATIEYQAGGGWVAGCPTTTSSKVRIISTGDAQARGVAGATSGDSERVEALYDYIPAYPGIPQIGLTGAAIYAETFAATHNQFGLVDPIITDSILADVQVGQGDIDIDCKTNGGIAGSVMTGNGSVILKNCNVTGSIHSSKNVTLSGGTVAGDVIAAGSVAVGGTVNGSVWSGGNTTVTGSTVKQTIIVAGTAASNATVTTGSAVMGDVLSSGTATVATGAVQGTVRTGVGGLTAPPVPVIPSWVDVPYPYPSPASAAWFVSSTWKGQGYVEIPWAGAPASCSVKGLEAAWMEDIVVPTVVNALNCPNGITTESSIKPIALHANVAIIAKSFTITKLEATGSGGNRKLWLVVPDNTANHAPTCVPPGDIYLNNETNTDPTLSVMVYTPCNILIDRNNWRGQLYGAKVQFNQQAQMNFAPVGIPGVNLGGPAPTPPSGAHLGSRTSFRDLSS
ncbi:polymer-forming cytoskeletal protein [Cryobacterium sp. TMT1-62]|uniref:polymer-forming cytoskeletal protein n=1 Tax=Cryobacterium sp. TMT1-62 TaxID=1259240 RepID=UPI00141B9921|nr:polymer-forming cytoskeletal protein [Cryobacterium sp. TMT1-62]